MTEYKKKDYITINAAARKIGVKKSVLQSWIEDGRIETSNGMVLRTTMESIKSIIDGHISVEEYLKNKDNERFDSRYVRNREEYIDYLQNNKFFGIDFINAHVFPYPYVERATYYFETKNISRLDKSSEEFFKYFGLSKQDICKLIIEGCQNDTTKRLLKKYSGTIESYTPSVTAFIKRAVRIDIKKIKEKEFSAIVNDLTYESSKELMISFIDFAKNELSLEWGTVEKKRRKTKQETGAYPYRVYVAIAKSIFNEEELDKNHVLEKTFDKSIDYETWLFLSTYYVCGWRTDDRCENWPHPSEETLKKLGVNHETIKEDVLGGRIDTNVYSELGAFVEKSIELSAVKANKTKKGSDLLAPINTELKVFFGRMVLIAEYHRNKSGEGKLQNNRVGEYLNFVRIKDLFGNAIYDLMGRQNLRSNSLNKSFLQSVEARARKDGAGTMAAYTIASYARNHSNIDTTAIYLYDHGLDGETAEVVLTMMLDRGVFGSIRYQELLAAFPDAFRKLTAAEQTKYLAECNVSSYELEVMGADMIAEQELKDSFAEGNTSEALKILSEMFEISQGFGKAKDTGIYCKKRAIGEACINPSFESCIANVCPYLIFSEAGIKSLVNVVNQYQDKAIKTGNPKYETILNDVIKPSFKSILAEISSRMSQSEKGALKKAIGEYYGEYTKKD